MRREQVRTLQLLLFSVGKCSVNERMFIHSFILSFEDLLYISGLSNRVTNKTNAVLLHRGRRSNHKPKGNKTLNVIKIITVTKNNYNNKV